MSASVYSGEGSGIMILNTRGSRDETGVTISVDSNCKVCVER